MHNTASCWSINFHRWHSQSELNFRQAIQGFLPAAGTAQRGFIVLKLYGNQQTLTATVVAQRLNNWDYLFIVCNIADHLLLYQTIPVQGSFSWRRLIISGILLAGLLDSAENIFISPALHDHSSGWHGFPPSASGQSLPWFLYLLTQLIVQGVVKSTFQDISRYLSGTLRLIWFQDCFYLPAPAFSPALWGNGPGQRPYWSSIALHSGDGFPDSISILAVLNWYLPKIYASRRGSRHLL